MTQATSRFDGRVALVTGGASGIGEATVRRLHAEGAIVAIADIRPDAIVPLVAELGPERTFAITVDMLDPQKIDAMIAYTVERFGRLDILINNAGVGSYGAVTDINLDHWREVMGVDVDGVFWASRTAMPHLVKAKGAIVNVASIAGMVGDYGFAAYNAAKAAVINLTRSMALDHAPEVRVNAVSPGLTATPLATGLTGNPSIMDAYLPVLPLRRPAEPREVAAAIAFLASDDASYITGHNLTIDGGLTAHSGQPNFPRILGGKSHLADAPTAVRR